MASSTSFLNLAAISMFLSLVGSLFSSQASGLSRGFPVRDLAPQPPDFGLCASSDTLRGYKCQEFEVTTDDGYIIGVQRIPVGLAGGAAAANRTPVLLQPGLLVDGMTWVLNPPEQSLATILADNGFDVWISNIRGTQFSRRHVNMTISNPEYWNWSWDELAEHELPSVIGFVFNETGQKVHYLGHSMGTLIAMTALSEGKLVDKLRSAVLLSPIAYLSHMISPLGVLAARTFLGETGSMVGMPDLDLRDASGSNFMKGLCANPTVNCYDMQTAFTGQNCCVNASTIELFLKNEPQPTSTKNLEHFAQTYRNGIVSKFDYGFANMQYYNQPTPPVYDLSKIPHDFPLFLSYGGQDSLSDVADVQTLLDVLKAHDQEKLRVQFVEEYSHGDFIMAYNAKDVLYNNVTEFFRQFS